MSDYYDEDGNPVALPAPVTNTVYTPATPGWTQQHDASGRPIAIDPGNLPSNLSALQGMQNNTSSPWTKMMEDKNSLAQRNATDRLNSQTSSGLATAQGNLAMRGGIGSGQATSLNRDAMQAKIMGSASLSNQGAQNQLAIGAKGQELNQQNASTWANMANNEFNQRADIAKNNYSAGMSQFEGNAAANEAASAQTESDNQSHWYNPFSW